MITYLTISITPARTFTASWTWLTLGAKCSLWTANCKQWQCHRLIVKFQVKNLADNSVKSWARLTTTTTTTFNGLFSRTTWVSRHQKGKAFWILLEQEMMGWQWHQLDHVQIICTLLQRDNHASISPLSFYRPDALPATQPTASKHWRHMGKINQNTKNTNSYLITAWQTSALCYTSA